MHASFFPYFLVTILVLELGYGMMSNALNLSTRGLRPLLLLVTVLPFDPKYFLFLAHVHSPSMTNDNNVCLHVWERWIYPRLARLPIPPASGGMGRFPLRSETNPWYINDSLSRSSGDTEGRVFFSDWRRWRSRTMGLLDPVGMAPDVTVLLSFWFRDAMIVSTRLCWTSCSARDSTV